VTSEQVFIIIATSSAQREFQVSTIEFACVCIQVQVQQCKHRQHHLFQASQGHQQPSVADTTYTTTHIRFSPHISTSPSTGLLDRVHTTYYQGKKFLMCVRQMAIFCIKGVQQLSWAYAYSLFLSSTSSPCRTRSSGDKFKVSARKKKNHMWHIGNINAKRLLTS